MCESGLFVLLVFGFAIIGVASCMLGLVVLTQDPWRRYMVARRCTNQVVTEVHDQGFRTVVRFKLGDGSEVLYLDGLELERLPLPAVGKPYPVRTRIFFVGGRQYASRWLEPVSS